MKQRLDAKCWETARSLLHLALMLPAGERTLFIAQRTCDSAVIAEVERLLNLEALSTNLFPLEQWAASLKQPVAPGTEIGHYRLLRELGSGGMGTVYLAERADGVYEQRVALKLLQENVFSPQLAERFRQERQMLARLQHPGIARLLDGGVTNDQRPYFVMEFIAGKPINVYCEEQGIGIADRVRLCVRVAEAVQSAHQQLVLHLDLKPANVLVTAEGTPRLLDFGISRWLSDAETATGQSGAAIYLLTPRYASPEQSAGGVLGVGSDVFSLATLLYRLLTGRLPYDLDGALPTEASRILNEVAPLLPSQAAPKQHKAELRGDLDMILLKALQKDPANRYGTVAAFSEDLQRQLASRPVLAHPPDLRYRVAKFLRRNRVASFATATVVLLLAVAAVAVVRATVVARHERATAERRLQSMRALAHSYIFDLDPQLEDIPGTTEVRRFVLENAQTYLQSMSREVQGDDGLLRETAQGYSSIGQVLGSHQFPSLRNYAAADETMQKGIALERKLVALHDDPAERGILLRQMRHYAMSVKGRGDIAGAQNLLREAWLEGQPLLQAGPQTPHYVELAIVAEALAQNAVGSGDGWDLADPMEGQVWLERAEQIETSAQPFLAPREATMVVHSSAFLALLRAAVAMRTGHYDETRRTMLRAVAATARGAQGAHQTIARGLAHQLLATYALEAGDVATAATVQKELLTDFNAFRGDKEFDADAASGRVTAGIIDLRQGRVASGRVLVRDGVKAIAKLYQDDSNNEVISETAAWALFRAAEAEALPTEERHTLCIRASEIAQAYASAHPAVLSANMLLGRCALSMALLDRAIQKVEAQHREATEASQHFQRALLVHPQQPDAARLMAKAALLTQH